MKKSHKNVNNIKVVFISKSAKIYYYRPLSTPAIIYL